MEERKSFIRVDVARPDNGTAGDGLGEGLPVRRRSWAWLWVLLSLLVLLGLAALFFFSTGIIRTEFTPGAAGIEAQPPLPAAKGDARKIKAQLPDRPYIAIDRTNNILWLRKAGGELIKQVVVSAGSGGILEEPNGKRQWIFDTPLGEFKIKGIQENPIWTKPDWAFIEDGEPIPKNQSERAEAGMLGEYAMALGHGYLIHGTLYERLLGRNVTHGCIRVGRDDLRLVVATVKVGDRVYIF
jgi:L,D-transpeptidase ErfK/SrfK